MTRAVRALVVTVLLVTVAACDGTTDDTPSASSGPSSASPTPFVAPPLRLPAVPSGGGCPVTEPSPWPHPDQAGRVLGPGPLHPVADYFDDGVLRLRDLDRRPDGTYTKKVRWIGSGYAGPVLVRAGRIDGPGRAGVEFSYLGEPRDGGHHAVLTRPDNDLPASTTVDGPGCYAYQVDGATFSVTVVFRAVAE
ncbi:hypothetical protein [Micromonospora sp. SH-82]|uniref:hypothetical protein n=1 Tax=Micromonospora sp. SH-82 TaxID=3132938 RepID=UPI003EB7D8E9